MKTQIWCLFRNPTNDNTLDLIEDERMYAGLDELQVGVPTEVVPLQHFKEAKAYLKQALMLLDRTDAALFKIKFREDVEKFMKLDNKPGEEA